MTSAAPIPENEDRAGSLAGDSSRVKRSAEALHESSAWLRGAIGELLASDRLVGVVPVPVGVVAAVNLDVAARPGNFRDNVCDRCETWFADGLHLIAMRPVARLVVTVGLCDACAVREGVA